jgi:hypothetical protein
VKALVGALPRVEGKLWLEATVKAKLTGQKQTEKAMA